MVRPRSRPGCGEQIVELYALWGQAALSRIDEIELEYLYLSGNTSDQWNRLQPFYVSCFYASSIIVQSESRCLAFWRSLAAALTFTRSVAAASACLVLDANAYFVCRSGCRRPVPATPCEEEKEKQKDVGFLTTDFMLRDSSCLASCDGPNGGEDRSSHRSRDKL